jgi:Glucodextranase, domain B/PASTA domain
MRLAPPLLALALLTAVTACGGDAKRPGAAGSRAVRVTIAGPGDQATTRSRMLTVHGSVSPADASVLVLGQPADVVAGAFSARVALQPGANVIDLEATAAGRSPALTALRITREMPITVPDLSHLTPEDARVQVTRLGLQLRTEDDGGLLEGILPGTPGVCAQRPGAGAEAHKGDTVTVLVAKRC